MNHAYAAREVTASPPRYDQWRLKQPVADATKGRQIPNENGSDLNSTRDDIRKTRLQLLFAADQHAEHSSHHRKRRKSCTISQTFIFYPSLM
jgi:hypothetical protein